MRPALRSFQNGVVLTLTDPLQKRKAQNRAAQRAFRERKERHLRDLETKVEELQKSSDMANEENGFLRSQVERLQVELREYRKRISWMTSNPGVSGVSAIPGAHSKGAHGLQNGEFLFDFPKFGDLPAGRIFNNGNAGKNGQNSKDNNPRAPGVLSRDALASPNTPSPVKSIASPASRAGTTVRQNVSSPVGAGNAKSNTFAFNGTTNGAPAFAKSAYAGLKPLTRATWDTSTSDSPSSSSDSHQSQLISSSGTSPEPSLNSPHHGKTNNAQGADCGCGTYRPVDGPIDGEKSFCAQLAQACGDINNPIPAARDHQAKASVINIPSDSAERFTDDPFGFDWLAQQNGGQFDPVLFGDWREPQDAVLSQDFGTFFNDAFPLPDLGSPSHNLTEVDNEAPKKDLLAQIDGRLDEEVVPGEDKSRMLNCTKIWYDALYASEPAGVQVTDFFTCRDHLQSNPRFQNGDIDVDSLCSELTKKAKCSEGGVVVNQKDVEDIMGRAK